TKIDPSGHDALKLVHKSGAITLIIPVKFSGYYTDEMISSLVARASSLQAIDDMTFNVVIVPTNTPIEGVLNEIDLSFPWARTFGFNFCGDFIGCADESGTRAHLDLDLDSCMDVTGATIHEALHLAGMQD